MSHLQKTCQKVCVCVYMHVLSCLMYNVPRTDSGSNMALTRIKCFSEVVGVGVWRVCLFFFGDKKILDFILVNKNGLIRVLKLCL